MGYPSERGPSFRGEVGDASVSVEFRWKSSTHTYIYVWRSSLSRMASDRSRRLLAYGPRGDATQTDDGKRTWHLTKDEETCHDYLVTKH
mgnify:CR=1 FL=1